MRTIGILLLFAALLPCPAFARADWEPLANLPGTVKAIDDKLLIIEDAEGNTTQFHFSKRTKYYAGSKQIKRSDIKPGDYVEVEARREIDASLEAVNVRLNRLNR